MIHKIITLFSLISSLIFSSFAHAEIADLLRLKQAYPQHIQFVAEHVIEWSDGSIMRIQDGKPNKSPQEKLENPDLYDQMDGVSYLQGIPNNPSQFNPLTDAGRIRYEPFFKKMYGSSKEEAEANLTTIYWMPKYFGNRYPLLVTTVNGVSKKLTHISDELEALVAIHPDYLPFLENPGGTFKWRIIANTNRLSPHSFGMTIDINSSLANYWQWDLKKQGIPVTEDAKLTYANNIPWEIILIFEKYGFIWGGKWHHYDSMHFEYRPELIHST